MNPFEVKNKINLYNSNPRLIPVEDLNELAEYAKVYGLPFEVKPQEVTYGESGIGSQFLSGMAEGFLGPVAFGGWADEPDDGVGAIANSMGHLLGFAVPMLGGVLTGGALGIAMAGSRIANIGKAGNVASKVGRGIQTGAGYLKTGGDILRSGSPVTIKGITTPAIKSIPMHAADYAQDKAKELLAKSGWQVAKHINAVNTTTKAATLGSKLTDTAFQAGHLSVASGVSGLFNGESDEMNNLLFGAVAGGAFGGLGNFVATGKMVQSSNFNIKSQGMKRLFDYSREFTKANQVRIMTMAGGSAFQGGMATIQGAPTSVQIYEYLLGGFFGWQAQGVGIKNAHEYISKFSKKGEDGMPLKTAEDFRSMTDKKHGFDELSLESQNIVKEFHHYRLGEYYNNVKEGVTKITESGAALSDLVSPLRDKIKINEETAISDLYSNKKEQLNEKNELIKTEPTETEILETKVKSLDRTIEEVQKDHTLNALKDNLYAQIVTGKESPESKQITDRLSPEEKFRLKNGESEVLTKHIEDFFTDKPYEKILTEADDIIFASERLNESQPEISSEPMLRRFLTQLQPKLVSLNYNSKDVLGEIINIYNNQKIEKYNPYNVKEFIDKIKLAFPGIEFDATMKNGLVQTFNMLAQQEIRPIISYDVDKGKKTNINKKNFLNKLLKTRVPKPADEDINVDKGLWGRDVKVLEFGEVLKKGKGGEHYTVKPYELRYDFETESYVSETSASDWINMIKQLYNRQGDLKKPGEFYLKIAKKDGGTERVYKFHKDTQRTSLDEIFLKVSNGDKKLAKKLRHLYEYDRDIWYETMGIDPKAWNPTDIKFLDKVWQDSFKSNHLYEPNYNFKNAAGRNKREPLFSSTNAYKQNTELFNKITKDTGEINVFVVDAETTLLSGLKRKMDRMVNTLKPETYNVLENGKIVEKAWGSKVDGWVVMHSELYKTFVEANGLDASTSHIKPQVAVEINGQLFMIKAGIHPSRSGYDKAMKEPNSMIVVTSSAKHLPKGLVPYTMGAKVNKKNVSFNMSGNKPHFKMPVKDFRINYGVYNDSHASKPTTIKKQMHSFMDALTMSRSGFDSIMDAMLDFPINGSDVTNKHMADLKVNPNTTMPKSFRMSEISDKHLIEIVNDPNHPLHIELNKEIFKGLRQMEQEKLLASDDFGEISEYANSFERLYEMTGYNPMVEVLNMNLYERSVHQYRLNRFTQPKWRESGSGWVAGVDPLMEAVTGGIKENTKYEFWDGSKLENRKVGHVKIGHSHKDMPIKWLDSQKKTLEEGYNLFLKEKNSSNPDKVLLGRMRQKLLLAVMRVPSNAVSGTRALLFDGFVENDVKMADYGVYMRARDHFYIDGADVDGDKVFFYQNMPKDFMYDLIRNDDFLERVDEKTGEKYLFDNKDKQFNEIFNSSYNEEKNANGISEQMYVEENPLSQWSPGALRKAGQSSFNGKQGMGTVVNTKSFMNMVLADVINNNGGDLNLIVKDSKGNEIGRLLGETNPDYLNSPTGYYVMGVEASSRTADSANFFRMADPKKVQDILFNSAFFNLRFERTENSFKADKRTSFDDLEAGNFSEKTKESISEIATFDKLRNSSEYGYLYDINTKLYGYDHKNKKNWSAQEVQETLANTQINPRHMSSILTIASHMKNNNLDINPLRNFNFKALKKNIKFITRNMMNDAEVRRMAVRNRLTVQNSRFSVDYKQIHDFMKKNFPEYETNMYSENKKSLKLGVVRSDDSKQAYADFIFEGQNGLLPSKELQAAFDKMYSPTEVVSEANTKESWITRHDPALERDFIINDSYDQWSAIALLQAGRRLKSAIGMAGKSLKGTDKNLRAINSVAMKLLNGEKLNQAETVTFSRHKNDVNKIIKEVKTLEKGANEEYSIFDTTQFRSEAQNESAVLRKEIAGYAESIKSFFRRDHVRKEIPVFENQDSANKKIYEYVEIITEKSKNLGIKPEVALDYFYTQLLSSLRPQMKKEKARFKELEVQLKQEESKYNARLNAAKETDPKTTKVEKTKTHAWLSQVTSNFNKHYNMTSTPRFVWDLTAIPNHVKKGFMKGYADAFDLLNTIKNKTELQKDVSNITLTPVEEIVKKDVPENRYEERIHTENKLNEALKIDRLSNQKIDTKSLNLPKDIVEKVLPSIKRTLLKDNTDMTTLYIEDLYTLMKAEGSFTGSTSIRDATPQDLRNFDRFLKEIVEAGAKNMKYQTRNKFIFPYSVGEKMNNQDMSNIYKMVVPYKKIDGRIGEASISIPMSAMTYAAKASNSIRRFNDATANALVENLFDNISIKNEVESLPDGVNLFNQLFEIAIKKGNANNPNKIEGRKEFYQEELASSKEMIDRLATDEKIYSITREGETVKVSGNELIKNITDQLSNYMQTEMYESWIGAGMLNSKGKWTKIDFKKIDDKAPKMGSMEISLHDIIRFDKDGAFDIENFYKKTVELAAEGDSKFSQFMGNRNNPFSVELMNRVQYEIVLEEFLRNKTVGNRKLTREELVEARQSYRANEKTKFKATGQIEGFYFPQMMHDVKKLNPYIMEQQQNLSMALDNLFNSISKNGKYKDTGDYKMPLKYKPKRRELELALGVGKKPSIKEQKFGWKNEKLLKDYYLQRQNEDFQMFTSSALENSLHHSEYAVDVLNYEYRKTQQKTKEIANQMKPGSGQARGEIPMPFFSYSSDVLTNYTKNWTNAYFNNLLSIMGKRVIDKYKKLDNVPNEAKVEWGMHLKDYITGQMGFGKTIPLSYLGLNEVQIRRVSNYIDNNKKAYDKAKEKQDKTGQIQEGEYQLIKKVESYKEKLIDDLAKKRSNGIDVYLADYLPTSWLRKQANKMPIVKDIKVKNFTYKITDQNMIDWMNVKSQGLLKKYSIPRPKFWKKQFGTSDAPKLPFIGELPTSERARARVLHRTLTNIGNFEAKMSLISLLSHPKTALGNILGGSQNTLSNNGMRHFVNAKNTKWLLNNVFKGARLKDGTRITDRNGIYRLISEHGALESFYVTEASMDKSLSVQKLMPFIREMAGIASKNPNYSESTWAGVAKKHKVFDSIVSTGGYFMRSSETLLRADSYLAHYLAARETYGQFIPDMKFDNPYLIKHALKGVEATQFLYHNVRRPEISTSAMGKMLTRFQPFMWNSIVFRKDLVKKAKRYGMTDAKSMDRLRRAITLDLTVMGLANIFVASVFDSILPPPLSYLQDTSDWLFGDPEERENAFFSSYPHPALAPLQVVTAPVHRLWMPAMTAMINGDYDRLTNYYIHTMYPFGRLARSLYKTYDAPEMFAENMLGIPVHKLGSKLRKSRKKNDEE